MQLTVPYKMPAGAGTGDMLKANNLADVVSAAAARANLGVEEQSRGAGRDAALEGGLVFDGLSPGGQLAKAACLNLGTGAFSLWLRFLVPGAATAGTADVAWLGSSGASPFAVRTLNLYYSTSGALAVRLYGATTADYRVLTLTNLRSTCAGKVIDLVLTRGASGVTVFVNGAVWTATSESASTPSPPAWTDAVTSSYLVLGNSGSTGALLVVQRAAVFNVALTVGEVAELIATGIPWRYRWGTGAPVYQSNFGAGADAWAGLGGLAAVEGNIDGIGGQNDALRLTSDGSTGGHRAGRTGVFALGKAYALALSYYCPGSNGAAKRFKVGSGVNGELASGALVSDAWTAFSGSLIAGATDTQLSLADAAGNTTFAGAAGDALYLREFSLTPQGALLDLDLGVGKGTYLPDRSNNRLWAEAQTNGITHLLELTSGALTIQKTFAHSDISATAATTKLLDLPANCGLVELEWDRETAFDAATTLDVGTSAAPGRYASAVAVGTPGKLWVEAAAKASESGTGWTTVYLRKNQATTQGKTTVRARYVVRGL